MQAELQKPEWGWWVSQTEDTVLLHPSSPIEFTLRGIEFIPSPQRSFSHFKPTVTPTVSYTHWQ